MDPHEINEKDPALEARRLWMNVLAQSTLGDLESVWAALSDPPEYTLVRGPETGLAMVQARAGGSGRKFNLGEMTITRCSLQTAAGFFGHAYVGGRSFRKAELAALFDAMLQDPVHSKRLSQDILVPLMRIRAERKKTAAEKTAATKVDFFTMVRGDD